MPAKEFDAFTRLDASDVNAYLANKSISNAIINGAFDIWQRGTSFSTLPNYTADRWAVDFNGSGATRTASQQSFTPGTAPELGYEGQFFFRLAQSVAGTGGTYNQIKQPIEDVRTFAGQTVTFSFWAKAAAATVIGTRYIRFYGSGGSTAEEASFGSPITLSTSWTRYTQTFTLPTLSGKTLGANSFLQMIFDMPLNSTFTVDIWGVQLESGTVANDFRRNANSIAGEELTCKRYYQRWFGNGLQIGLGTNYSSSQIEFPLIFEIPMRVAPSLTATSGAGNYAMRKNGGDDFFNSITFVNTGNKSTLGFNNTEASGVAGYAGAINFANENGLIQASAEL
jgi:hypothetical protein